jgi:hypothetical protein
VLPNLPGPIRLESLYLALIAGLAVGPHVTAGRPVPQSLARRWAGWWRWRGVVGIGDFHRRLLTSGNNRDAQIVDYIDEALTRAEFGIDGRQRIAGRAVDQERVVRKDLALVLFLSKLVNEHDLVVGQTQIKAALASIFDRIVVVFKVNRSGHHRQLDWPLRSEVGE